MIWSADKMLIADGMLQSACWNLLNGDEPELENFFCNHAIPELFPFALSRTGIPLWLLVRNGGPLR
jgi:hypothetical protein